MATIIGTSANAKQSAVKGTNTSTPVAGVPGSSVAVEGESDAGWGVYGHSKTGRGVVAISEADYGLRAGSTKSAGLRSSSVEGRGAEGWSVSKEGVVGTSETGVGVYGTGTGVAGVVGDTQTGAGIGVEGRSGSNAGVLGSSNTWRGLDGRSTDNAGVFGSGKFGGWFEGAFEGVHAVSRDPGAAGVAGYNESTGPGIFGKSNGGPAGFFAGDMVVTGNLRCADVHVPNADCAEDFDVVDPARAEPGTVMVLGAQGVLDECRQPYDRRVAGVVSGAGGFRPGLTLDRHLVPNPARKPLAMLGKTYCKVDASRAPIEIGDMLTTSDVAGYAMKAEDPGRAFGAVIGKALHPLAGGKGLIPILITLQ